MKTRFSSVFRFVKLKNTFLKRFPSLQKEETHFRSVSHLYKIKNTFSKRFSSLQKLKICFWNIVHLYEMKKHLNINKIFKVVFFRVVKMKTLRKRVFSFCKYEKHFEIFFFHFFKHEHQLISTSRLFRNVMVRFLDSLWIFSVHSNS